MLDEEQKQALNMALDDTIQIMYLSGQAGTGKSYVGLEIEKALSKKGWLISKVAPTGKAARRIKGRTIHSWLEPIVEENAYGDLFIKGFSKTSFSDKEVLLVDESSMIDSKLWNEILDIFYNTLYDKKKIIFIGDVGQLEPVGEGTPFLDNIYKTPFRVELTTIHRQKDGNDIVILADAIRNNKSTSSESFKNVAVKDRKFVIDLALNDIENVQILSPKKNGINGTNEINKEIQSRRNLKEKVMQTLKWEKIDGKNKLVNDKEIFVGDKIVVTRNLFSLDLTNGTTGIVIGDGYKDINIYKFGMKRTVKTFGLFIKDTIDGEKLFIPYDWGKKQNVDLAYSLTVHKFQGSDSPIVCTMFTPDQMYYVTKKLIYTAVTRAKEMLYVVE